MAFPSNNLTRNNHNHNHNHNHCIKEEVEKQNHRRLSNGVHEEDDVVVGSGTPIRYVPLRDVYSATSPCVSASGSSNVMSKKVKARKLLLPLVDHFDNGPDDLKPPFSCFPSHNKPPIVHFYSRRRKRLRQSLQVVVVKSENIEDEGGGNDDGDKVSRSMKKKRKGRSSELSRLGVDSSIFRHLEGPRLRESRNQKHNLSVNTKRGKKGDCSENRQKIDETKMETSGSLSAKRWVRLSFEGVDPRKFIGLACKVFWPLDADWYSGDVVGYNSVTGRHHVKYEDGDEEDLILRNEKTKFYLSSEEMQSLDFSFSVRSSDTDEFDFSEMVVLAASLDDCHEHGPGDIIWAKITGHAMWPAVVVDDSLIGDGIRLKRISGGRPVTVQFFGTHDFARVNTKQVISFLRGLLSSFHQKCKKPNFVKSLEEAKMYLCEQKLPKRMLRMQSGIGADDCESASGEDEGSADSGEDCVGDETIQRKLECLTTCPLEIGDLRVISLGKIVKDSDYFQDERFIWPEGYTAVRKFTSITDPSIYTSYKMEVLRDADSMIRPLFKVTTDNGEQFKGSTPSACWNKVYRRIRKLTEGGSEKIFESGSYMFGFSNPEVSKLIQGLSNSKLLSKSSISKLTSGRHQGLHVGYRPVHVQWKDLDKCSVCHMDEEYENNLFLQCDKCRMMVHARCYGELEPVDGVLWFCNLCRPGAPDFPPPCCLCPVIGGAMKPTTDGRWAHLACAIWIPETCLSDIKKMEPIDGLSRINKDRWKLLCSICGVSYGACIQCSNNTCRVAYHPLCARAAGFCVELEDEDRLHLISMDEDEEDQCIRLLSFCKKHRLPSNERSANEERIGRTACQYSDYTPPSNPSGCARSEPYNYFGRRGRKEPEALVAASLKRLFVENRPYLVGGICQQESFGNSLSSSALVGSKLSFSIQKLKTSQLDAPKDMLSMAEKYKYMRETFRKRLAFGKSGIHGFGIFTKHPHRAGDMVIEYTGELVRPPIADRREHLIYNSLVGAGTYMFRIDDERVIDATRAGSIAHLINHSCEPNCYSRVISVNRDEHIIIFAKRDIQQWEELTYDYRFFSIDEQLACYCGFPRCRGVVNDIEAEEQVAKLYAPRNELVDWKGE